MLTILKGVGHFTQRHNTMYKLKLQPISAVAFLKGLIEVESFVLGKRIVDVLFCSSSSQKFLPDSVQVLTRTNQTMISLFSQKRLLTLLIRNY